MVRFLLLAVLSLSSFTAYAAKNKSADMLHKDGMKAFERSRFEEAAKAFSAELKIVAAEEPLSKREQDVRERLALSLFSAGDKEGAKRAYSELIDRYPTFHFNPDEVFPETVAFFESAVPRKPEPTPPEIVAAPSSPESQPIELKTPDITTTQPTKGPWKWYYLAPLGIGQFLAGSPVRGAILLIAELGFVAMNVVGYVLLEQQRTTPGTSMVRDEARANDARLVMNIGFFGVIASAIYGIVDGAVLEP